MIYGYIRVSTDKQTVENQRYEIQKYCDARHLAVDRWIEETVSGTKAYRHRTLGTAIKRMTRHDTLICTELSRLGRSLFMIMEILSKCLKKGCRVYTIKDNYQLGDNIESKVLAFAFGLSAEIERTLISQRTREALDRLKQEGKQLGRPKGSKGKCPKLKDKAVLVQELRSKYSVRQTCKILRISRSTFYRRGY
ncbi:MAG: master DNA invertase Mpi family serine-type recombinase [Bacteroides sp.]|nr:master DNA invertase Mpi family serine-type recombinase [Bacteroides sp.]MCM1447553.1 master DNA invertase Mpi family serine-type recombinase [Bacteroides sp.]MCM1516661.1 master DNA invertase Mpi family serine-type recombinase [Paraprevotella sp.]